MSTPMHDEPERLAIDVDKDGDGPAFGDDAVRTVCWCGQEGCAEFA